MQKRNENNSTVVNIKEEEDKIKTKPHWYEKRKVFFQIRNLIKISMSNKRREKKIIKTIVCN